MSDITGTVPAETRARLARAAGAAYAVIIVCGVWAEGIARPGLIRAGDPAATAEAIAAGLALFRASILADLLMAVADVTLAVLFLRLLFGVSAGLAVAAFAFRLVQAALIAAGLVALAAVPGLALEGEGALVALFLTLHATAYDVGLVFFALNAALMAVLLVRSGGVPRVIALGIGASGAVYLAGSVIRLAAPDLGDAFAPAYALPLLAESALCLWLLAKARI